MAVVTGMKFGVQADFVQFDVKKWSVDQKKAVVKAMKNAAKAWLQIIVERTPRDSGFLLSAFDNLATALGVSISGKSLKKGLGAYGKGQILANLENRYLNLRELAAAKKWLEAKTKLVPMKNKDYKKERKAYKNASKDDKFLGLAHKPSRLTVGEKITGYKRAINKPLTQRELKSRARAYKKKRDEHRRKKAAESEQTKTRVGNLLEEGLNIRSKTNVEAAEKKSIALFRREQAKKFYEEQRNRKAADRVLKRLSRLRGQIREQKIKYNKALDTEPPLKQKRRGKRYKWEKVEITKDVTKQRLVEVKNPAYSARAVLDARKNKTVAPTPTIKVMQSVTEKETKTVRRRIKAGSDKDWEKIYRKYYYPRNGQKGPIKNPETGRAYGTPADQVFFMETQSGKAQSVSEETEDINKGGFEIPGRELGGAGYTPARALSNVSPVRESKLKITFQYGVDIRYWKLMDTLGRWNRGHRTIKAKGAPWGAFIKANLAYQSILKRELEAAILPFTSYCVKTTSKFAPGFKGGL